MTDLSALIARLEAAEVGSRDLDGAICAALGEQPEWATKNHAPTQPQLWTDGKPGLRAREWLCPIYTTSLDAALALAERVLGEDQALEILADEARAALEDTINGSLKRVPIDVCINVILRAKQGEA